MRYQVSDIKSKATITQSVGEGCKRLETRSPPHKKVNHLSHMKSDLQKYRVTKVKTLPKKLNDKIIKQ